MKLKRSIFDNIIKKEHCFDYGTYEKRNAINIAFAVNDNFIRPVGVAMTSILESNKLNNVVIHIFINEIDARELLRFNKAAQAYKCKIYIYQIDDSILANLNSSEFTIAAYYRFIIPYRLQGSIDKVLYLDADTCCLQSLDILKDINFGDNIACVVRDQKIVKIKQAWSVQETLDDYFNSGMMYIDINNWQAADISYKCLEWLFKHSYEVRCADQDALNIILKDKVLLLERKYNYMCDLSNAFYKNVLELPGETIIVHFVGFNKPWHLWCSNPLNKYFRKYSDISLWNDVPLDDRPAKYRQMRMLAKFYLRERKIFQALYWGYKSTIAKLF